MCLVLKPGTVRKLCHGQKNWSQEILLELGKCVTVKKWVRVKNMGKVKKIV